MMRVLFFCVGYLACASAAQAGLHYSGEKIAELPSQWRGYLLDQKALRILAVPLGPNRPATPILLSYQADRERLEKLSATRTLSADESADLGALCIRLGQPDKAVELLRTALRASPQHFAIAANLGTACQLVGELNQAASALEIAVGFAPPRWKSAERMHLKLVQGRLRETKRSTGLDQLLTMRFTGAAGPVESLPDSAVADMQALGLWLPADGRVLWQLGELANATGDTATAAAILDGCVTEFGMDDRDLREHRRAFRAAAPSVTTKADGPAAHQSHQPTVLVKFRSLRPLIRQNLALRLPEIRPTGLNPVPWELIQATTLETPFRPTFASHLQKLNGKRVVLTGFMEPTGDGLDQTHIKLLEYQIGCWWCEQPDPTAIVIVEAAPGRTFRLTRDMVRVEGTIHLNFTDPEDYLYTIKDAKVGEPQ